MLFKKKADPVLGIDITATTIKLLELGKRGDKFSVESYAVEPLPPEAVVDKSINDIESVGDAISRAVKKSGSKLKAAAVAVSGSSVITKTVQMPAGLTDDDLESQIQVEADQYIPFPLDEVAIDFQVLGETEDNPDQVDVLLAASRSEDVYNRVASLDFAGVKAKIVDVEAYTLENTLALVASTFFDDPEDKIIAVADVGSVVTVFTVFKGLKTIYSREQVFGGQQLTETIQNAYGLSFEEAGIAKKQGAASLPGNYEQDVLNPFKSSMAQNISRAQQFFYSSSDVENIDHLFIAGGCAAIPGIIDFIFQDVGVPTSIMNPFENMPLSRKVSAPILERDAPAMIISCGLALRSFE